MTRSGFALAVLIGGAAAAIGWWIAEPSPRPVANRAGPPASIAPADRIAPAEPSPQESEQAFREGIRRFVDGASTLDAGQRHQRAARWREQVLRREQSGDLLPAESAYLQLSLLRVTVTDPLELQRRSQALLEEYQARSDAGWQAHRERPDVRHQAYRAAEAELVRSATTGPDPLPQDELRRRLQALREQYYEPDLQ